MIAPYSIIIISIIIIDVGTDILEGARVRSDYKAATVIPEVIAVMQEYGMPVALRFDRCDLSLFQVGGRLLHYLTREELPIRVGFVLINEMVL